MRHLLLAKGLSSRVDGSTPEPSKENVQVLVQFRLNAQKSLSVTLLLC